MTFIKENNIFILTDPTIISINYIQQARKKADNNFNDFVAQLYEQEFKTQEKEKEEHIKQAKEKAIEEQREQQEILQQRREKEEKDRIAKQESERIEQERISAIEENSKSNNDTRKQLDVGEHDEINNDWSSVSPEMAANYMASKTGVSASKWLDVIYKESSGNPYALNSLSCYGFLQIMQSIHGQVSNLSPQEYLDKAVNIYRSSGGTAWATW